MKNKSTVAGTLAGLAAAAVLVETSRGAKTFKRDMRADESRKLLLAEDYAKAMAYEKTRNNKLHTETTARLERGEKLSVRLAVKDKLDAKKYKEVSSKGDYITQTTTKLTKEESSNLEITLSNQSAFDTILAVRWYFIARSHSPEEGVKLVADNWGGQWLPVEGRKILRHPVASPTFKLVENIEEHEDEDGATKKHGVGSESSLDSLPIGMRAKMRTETLSCRKTPKNSRRTDGNFLKRATS